MSAADRLAEVMESSLQYARTSERLRAAMVALGPAETAIVSVGELDPEIQPELTAAAEHLEEVLAALDRAFVYQTARYEVALGRLRDEPPLT